MKPSFARRRCGAWPEVEPVVLGCAGYVNTNAYVLAPKAVLPSQKATAAGILAVTYQAAHVCGLLLGTVICFLVFAGF